MLFRNPGKNTACARKEEFPADSEDRIRKFFGAETSVAIKMRFPDSRIGFRVLNQRAKYSILPDAEIQNTPTGRRHIPIFIIRCIHRFGGLEPLRAMHSPHPSLKE